MRKYYDEKMIMRPKFRYVLLESSEDLNLIDKESISELRNRFRYIMGEQKYLDAEPKIKLVNKNRFVIKVNRGSEEDIVLASCFIKDFSGKRIGLYTVKTSGSIRAVTKSI
jgi:RNase P/RNase MRP subunit POP5